MTSPWAAALAARPGRLLALVHGASYPVRALHFLTVHRLWAWALAPAVGALAVWATAVVGAVGHLGPWLEHLWWYGPGWPVLGEPARWAVARVLLAVVAGPPLVLWAAWMTLLTAHVVSSPLMARLSVRVEELATGRARRPLGVAAVGEAVVVALGDFAMALVYLPLAHVGLLALALVPGLGGAAVAAAAAMALAQQFVGLPLARRWVSYRLRWQVVRERPWWSAGFGGVLVLAWVLPGINLVALPVATCAGTLAFCDLAREGALDGVHMRDPPGAAPTALAPRGDV